MRLRDLGWDDGFAHHFEPWAGKPHTLPGRVFIAFNYICRVYSEGAEMEAVVSGRIKHQATSRSELPVVGDWVAVRRQPGERRGSIAAVLPRRSRFSRKLAGQVTDEQVVAANINVVFIVMGLDPDFNLRRVERYMLLARDSGAAPVVLLTKPDLSSDVPGSVAAVTALAGDTPVHVLSPKFNEGVDQLLHYLTPGRTGALLGSSGVGKTTIINRLMGTERKTREVRDSDSRGRHTTTNRELVVLPNGGLLIDTPGMRELQLWDVGTAVRGTFEEIEQQAAACHFTDCRHRDEPRCAVKAAVADGRIPADRLESYLKLQEELAHLTRQQDQRAQIEEKRKAKSLTRLGRAHIKSKRF